MAYLKARQLTKTEIRYLTHLNSTALAAFSVGGFFVSLLAAIWLGSIFVDNPVHTEFQKFVLLYGSFATGGLAIISFFVGGLAIWNRRDSLKEIDEE